MSKEKEVQFLSILSSLKYFQRSNVEIKIFFAAMAIAELSRL